jgi:uncharacterized protein YkwD
LVSPSHALLLLNGARCSGRDGRIAGAALLALLLANGPATGSPAAAVNRARSLLCAPSGGRELRQARTVDAVAERLARGDSLHRALGLLPARPELATSIHLIGFDDDRSIAAAVAGRYCRDLSDPHLREIGIARTGRDLWIVVIAPLDAPAPDDQPVVAREILARVNDARVAGRRCGGRRYPPVAPLHLTGRLSRVALEHSADMAHASNLDHRGRDGSSPAERVRRSGYGAQVVGENIAGGVPTAADVVDGWLASPGHCANIMDGRFTEMGLAYAVEPSSRLEIYWTQLLALPR